VKKTSLVIKANALARVRGGANRPVRRCRKLALAGLPASLQARKPLGRVGWLPARGFGHDKNRDGPGRL
jgi:hypothetical protein